MKTNKISVDFEDVPNIIEMLRTYSVTSGKSQKGILIEALESYFSDKIELKLLSSAADRSFSDWNNKDDEVYNDL